ncbi:ShlB/FhaC/HecB family hemolysin secretion/activation protein [Psychroflexus sediminis]|uniref:Haemolysin activator HlyB C-terminal domain-containing protein n=1 Tax=Psychroflexus sediminis TaxID=470826 RepID=A0A1G7U3F0_9FLAO|nr:ShlB/FhaC/HecB family hemolysin secretion/activation protein [Psychroflexus sediminis]SDG41983.1 hypothetical protein SAMN04488027_101225 [Psychroflexus sediminis]
MSKHLLFFIIALGISKALWAQSVSLHLETKTDSTIHRTALKFNSFEEAEGLLKSKLDSLKQTGYPFLSEERKITNNALFVSLDLNQKIDSLIINIEEKHAPLLPKDLRLKNNQANIAYSEADNFLETIVYNMKNEGSSFGKTSLTNIKVTGKAVIEADLWIQTGLQRTIDKIHIKGYSALSKTYIARFSNLKTGDIFIESDIQNKTEQLNTIAFINLKKPTEVLFKKDSTELFIYLEKVNSNSFDGFLGFASTDENDLQLNGYLNMVLLNNLDFGERLNIQYKNDGTGQQRFEGHLRLPFLFKSPLSLEAGLRLFRRDSSFSNASQLLNLNYQIDKNISLEGGVEFTKSTNLEGELASSSEITGFNSTFYGLGFNYYNLKSRQGFNEDTFLHLKAALGQRKTGETSEQYKFTLSGQHQFALNTRNQLYVNLNGEILISDTFFNNELFRFGGVNSIRGFVENSLFANRYAVLQTEYRYVLDSNIFVNTVLDLGYYENNIQNINENLLGYGIGLGLKSKAGLFRLILANSISDNQPTSLSSSKVHISFTSFF